MESYAECAFSKEASFVDFCKAANFLLDLLSFLASKVWLPGVQPNKTL